MNNTSRNIILVSILVISSIMHFKHFSKDLTSIHVWRQAQTQSTIINFYEEDMNIFNPRRNNRGDTEGIHRMEFPLMQWLVACLYKIFGSHLIITRIAMFLIGFLTIIGVYMLLYALFNNELLSTFGAWAFTFSPSFYYYTINPLPDNLALCCSIWGMTFFFLWYNNNKTDFLMFSSFLLGIGALCKLPFIIYYIVPIVYLFNLIRRNGFNKKVFSLSLLTLCFSALPITWYLSVIPYWEGNPIVKGMLNINDSPIKLLDYYQHNLFSTLPELLLNYGSVVFFLAGFYFLVKKKSFRDPRFILLVSLSIITLTFYLFEANTIRKVHDYYLFPFYPLLFILVASGAYNLYASNIKFFRYITVVILLILPVTCYLRMRNRWNIDSPGFNKDLLLFKTELKNAIPKNALVVAGNDKSQFIFLYYIDKKGWAFDNDKLTPEQMESMIENGAEYIYTDSEVIHNHSEISKYFDKLILKKGSIKIFSLKR